MHRPRRATMIAILACAGACVSSASARARTEGDGPPDSPARAEAQAAATPAASEPPPAASEPPPTVDRPDDTEPHKLRVGAIAGVGFPRPLAIEPMVVLSGYVAIGGEYGVLPSMTVDGVTVSLWSLAGDVRVFPFRGAFFVGLRAGHQHVDASTTITVAPYGSAPEQLSFDSFFVNPRIGFLWTSNAGLTLGVEAGLQIPLTASTDSSLPLSLVPSAQSAAQTLGGTVLPTVDLLRIGMLF